MDKIAIYAISKKGAILAAKLQACSNVTLFVHPDYREYLPNTAQSTVLKLPLSAFIKEQFNNFKAHIIIGALSIAVRVIAPLIVDKFSDPGVLSIDEQGDFVISVLGGHCGGANLLCAKIAASIGAQAVITTASDRANLISVDILGREFNWQLATKERAVLTKVAGAIVNCKDVAIIQECASSAWQQNYNLENASIYTCWEQAKLENIAAIIYIGARELPDFAKYKEKLVIWRPLALTLGIGCDKNTPLSTIEQGLDLFLKENMLAKSALRGIYSIDLKAHEVGILELAAKNNLTYTTYSPAQLDNLEGVLNPSAYVKKITGTNSVAEAAALYGAGANKLLVGKTKFKAAGYNVTYAVSYYRRDA